MQKNAQMIKIKKNDRSKSVPTIPSPCKSDNTTHAEGSDNEDGDYTAVMSHIKPCPCPPPKKSLATISSKMSSRPSMKSSQRSEWKKSSKCSGSQVPSSLSNDMNRRKHGTKSENVSFDHDSDIDNECDKGFLRSRGKESDSPPSDKYQLPYEKQAEAGCKKKRGFRAGFWSKCCPCCVTKPKSRPSSEIEDSRPGTRICLSGMSLKTTQTCPEDFRCAKKCFEAATQLEKRRNAMFRDSKKNPNDPASFKGRKSRNDPRSNARKVADVLKAQQLYRQKRKMMEAKITKQLEKEVGKRDPCCGIKAPE